MIDFRCCWTAETVHMWETYQILASEQQMHVVSQLTPSSKHFVSATALFCPLMSTITFIATDQPRG